MAERLLSISGEDAITIHRKNITAWTGTLPTRFMMVTNELPEIGDASGALPSRFIILRFTESFYGQEDTQLTDRLATELPGILNWAIEGWRRLQHRGSFIQPKSADELVENLHELSSPITEFVRQQCELGAELSVPTTELYAAWREWCKSQGNPPGTSAILGKELRAAFPGIKKTRPRSSEGREQTYSGIKLRGDHRGDQ